MLLIVQKRESVKHQRISHVAALESQAFLVLLPGHQVFLFLRSDTPLPPASCLPKFPCKAPSNALPSRCSVEDGFRELICSMALRTVHCYWSAAENKTFVVSEGRMQHTFCCHMPASPPLLSGFFLPWLPPLLLCFIYRYIAICMQ